MFISPYMTSVTAAHVQGKRLADCEPKLEKKYVPSGYVTPKRLRSKDYTCSEPARTRAGQTYPGGKQLRRRMKKLSLRQSVSKNIPEDAMPGSMN